MSTDTEPKPTPHTYKLTDRRSFGGRTSVAGITISVQYVQACARLLDRDDATAIKWLSGYARLLDLSTDHFAAEFGMDAYQVREAMVNPQLDATTRAQFTGHVLELRRQFEEGLHAPFDPERNPFPKATPFYRAYGRIAETSVTAAIREAVQFADEESAIVRVLAKERIGKTLSAAHLFLGMLDRAAWVRVPAGAGQRIFLSRIADGLGTAGANDNNTTVSVFMQRIERTIGPGKIEVLFLDQAHWLWPEKADKLIALRHEAIMDWNEQNGLGVVQLTTDQDNIQRTLARKNQRHAFGQIIGRTETYVCGDSLTDADIEAIVRLDAAEMEPAVVSMLVNHCKATPGYLGSLRLTIRRIAHTLKNGRPNAGETQQKFKARVVYNQLAAAVKDDAATKGTTTPIAANGGAGK